MYVMAWANWGTRQILSSCCFLVENEFGKDIFEVIVVGIGFNCLATNIYCRWEVYIVDTGHQKCVYFF